MDYLVQRIFEGGRLSPRHVRMAGIVRGQISVAQEHDTSRHRAVLVARITCVGQKTPPPLYDVMLVGTTGQSWTLAGYERIEDGPLPQAHVVGQAWLIEPVALQDLMDVEQKWSAAARRAYELEQQLIALGFRPDAPAAG